MAMQLALLSAQMYLGIIFAPRPKRLTFQDLLDSNKGDETKPIPYIRGKWKTKPQRIWLGDFSARAVERDSIWTDYIFFGVVGAALLDFITVGYTYYVGQGFALTWGPINRVSQVYVDDLLCAVPPTTDNAGGSLLLDFPTAFGGDQPPGQGGIYSVCDILPGTYTQARNPYLQSIEGNIPALHGVAALIVRGRSGAANSGYFSANGLNIHDWQVELMAWPDVLATGNARLPDDSFNRIHAMYEWATHADFGAQFPLERIHLDSWRAAAATCYSDGLGFSGEINTGGNVGTVFDELRRSVDAEVYEHPSDGLKIKLIRKDYSIPSLPVLSEANCNRVEEYTPGDYADTFNRVTLNYTNADNNYQPRPAVYEDPANFHIQQRVASKQIEYPGVASAELAQKLVTRDGRALAQPWPPLILSAGEIGRRFWPGDCYRFTWPSPLLSKVLRVHARTPSVSFDGEKNFRLTATEDQYSIGLSVFGTPSDTDATNPGAIWVTAPPSAVWDDAEIPPDGLEMFITTGLAQELQTFIRGAIEFGAYAGGQYARVYVTPPGGAQSLTPLFLSPDANDKAVFVWPALIAGTYEFCVQTYSLTGTTNGTKVCATIAASSFSVSPSFSTSPSASVSPSVSPSGSASPSASTSPSMSTSPSGSDSASPSSSTSPSSSVSESASTSPSASISSSASPSLSPSASESPSSSVSPSSPPPTLPAFEAEKIVSGTTGASGGISWPAHLAGDVALLIVQSVGAEPVTLSTPAGFVEVANSPQATGTDLLGSRITVFWCRATSSSMTSPVVADAGDHIVHDMVTYRGCISTGDPWDVTAGDVKDPASTTLTYPSVTTTIDNCLIVMIGTRDLDSSSSWHGVPVNVNLSDITERADSGSTAGVGGGIALYDGAKVSAGSTGTSPATVTSSINAMMTIALKGE